MTKFARDVEVKEVDYFLNCSSPGCMRPWSINLGRMLCSAHQWGPSQRHDSAANSSFAHQDFGADGKGWARRMLARRDAGERVQLNNVKMAENALEREKSGSTGEM